MKCKCSKIRKRLIRQDGDGLPDDLRAAVDACSDCRRFFERVRMVRQLLALKNEESPADYGPRCVANVHRRLAVLLEENTAERADWREIWMGPVPAFRFGVAALFVVFFGLHMLTSTPPPLTQWTPQAEMRTLFEAPARTTGPWMEPAARGFYEQSAVTTASNGRPLEIRQPPPVYFQFINLEP